MMIFAQACSGGGSPPATELAHAVTETSAPMPALSPTGDATSPQAFQQKYAGVVIVSRSGGDYTSIQNAIDSISDASSDNPYLVWIVPGVYVEQVTLKPYIHLQGAGQEATVITSAVSNTVSAGWPLTEATLVLASHTSLRDLTVRNIGSMGNVSLLATDGTTHTLVADVIAQAQGTGTFSYAVVLIGSGTDVILQNVTALGENATFNNGLYNYNGATATLSGGSYTGRGGSGARGIFNTANGATLTAEGVIALGEKGEQRSYGLYNSHNTTAYITQRVL